MSGVKVSLEVKLVHNTGRAVAVDDGDREVFVPLSAIEEDLSGAYPGDTITITISERLAMDKGLL